MKVKFEKILDGVNRFIDSEIYGHLNDLQEVLARIVVGRVNSSAENIKAALMSNGILMTLCLIDSDGMVEIDRLMNDIRKEVDRKGCIEFSVPMIGKMKFTSRDVEVLRSFIVEE